MICDDDGGGKVAAVNNGVSTVVAAGGSGGSRHRRKKSRRSHSRDEMNNKLEEKGEGETTEKREGKTINKSLTNGNSSSRKSSSSKHRHHHKHRNHHHRHSKSTITSPQQQQQQQSQLRLKIKIKPFNKPPAFPKHYVSISLSALRSSLMDALYRRSPRSYYVDYNDNDDDDDSKCLNSSTSDATSTTTKATRKKRSPSSREELYQMVQDLCAHSHGSKLYILAKELLDDASLVILKRLLPINNKDDNITNSNNGEGENNNMMKDDILSYPTPSCQILHNNNYNTSKTSSNNTTLAFNPPPPSPLLRNNSYSRANCSPTNGNGNGNGNGNDSLTILNNIMNCYNDYLIFVERLLSIFLYLDGSYIYLPLTGLVVSRLGLRGGVESTINTGRGVASVATSASATTTAEASSINNNEMINDGNSTGKSKPLDNGPNGILTASWGLWEVAMNSLLNKVSPPTFSTFTSSFSSFNSSDYNSSNNNSPAATVLQTLRSCTIMLLLAELDSVLEDNNITSKESQQQYCNNYKNHHRHQQQKHNPLVRNVILMISSLGDTGGIPDQGSKLSSHNSHYGGSISKREDKVSTHNSPLAVFIQEFISALIIYIDDESNHLSLNSSLSSSSENYSNNGGISNISISGNSSGNRSGKTGYDARAVLTHIDIRLQSVADMVSYYLPNSSGNSTDEFNRKNDTNIQGVVGSPTSSTIITANDRTSLTNNTTPLIRVVEERLISPHYTFQLLLAPTSLHPLLDAAAGSTNNNDNNDGRMFVQRLYLLSHRVRTPTTIGGGNGNMEGGMVIDPNNREGRKMNEQHPGIEQLRLAFELYGKEQGSCIVRQQPALSPINNKTTTTITTTTQLLSTTTMASRDRTDKRIIPDLLQFKKHLESLVSGPFQKDESFIKTVRVVLEEVLNTGGSINVAGVGDTGDVMRDTSSRRRRVGGSGGYRHRNGGEVQDADGGRRIAELLASHVNSSFRNPKILAVASSSLSSSNRPVVGGGSGGGGNVPLVPLTLTDEKESHQNAIVDLFRYVQSKDVFEAFYRRDLAKRLVSNRSASIDVERAFVQRLRAECGAQYTSKMEGMFQDMEMSNDVMRSYTEHIALKKSPLATTTMVHSMVGMDVQVLTAGYWPVYPRYAGLILPPSIVAHQDQFNAFYKDKFQGRRIEWQHSSGSCVVKAYFPKAGSRELVITLCQALVLLCFNEDNPTVKKEENVIKKDIVVGHKRNSTEEDSCTTNIAMSNVVTTIKGWTVLQVMEKIGIEDRAEVELLLHSLSKGRPGTRVLSCTPHVSIPSTPIVSIVNQGIEDNNSSSCSATKKMTAKKYSRSSQHISDSDTFSYNANFTTNKYRINIPRPIFSSTSSGGAAGNNSVAKRDEIAKEERSRIHREVSKDRCSVIDAAIVRIMKARKTMEHSALVGEVLNHLRFPAEGGDVKKRIEILIEREYIQRVEGDRSRYNYLA